MNKWHQTSVGDFIDFNPSERLIKDQLAKKVPMDKLGEFQRKLKGFEYSEYKSGPKFKNGDTLVAKITPCLENGKTAFVDILNENEVAYGSSEFIVLRENVRSDKKFIYYLARSPLFRNKAISCMEGTSGRKRVNEGALKRQEILVPELKEQQKIAGVLSALDDKIELNNQITTVLEQIAKTLYDYWFVQFDFPDTNGKPYKSSGGKMMYNNILKREVPKGWEVKQLKQIVAANKSQISSKTAWNFINYLDTSNITNNQIQDIVKLNIKDIPSRAKRLVEAEDVIFSTVRPNQRHFGILKNLVDNMVVSTGFTVLSHKTNKIYNNIIYAFLASDTIVNFLQGIAQNSVSSYPSINPEDILNLSICLPNQGDILNNCAEKLDSINKKIAHNQQQNKELATLRDWILPMLMNGQVRVSDSAEFYEVDASIAATPQKAQGTTELIKIPASKKSFAKQVLAGKIVTKFISDPNFTDIKFQKVQFLAEHLIEVDLNLNYYYQAAGPYDNKFMHTIYDGFRKQKWFDCKNKQFIPMEKQEKIEAYFQGYFAPVQPQLYTLFDVLYYLTEAEAEIIATLYAVWNNRIIKNLQVTNKELIEDFYEWSNRKQRYNKSQIEYGLEFLRKNQIEPRGFGQLIKRAKNKN